MMAVPSNSSDCFEDDTETNILDSSISEVEKKQSLSIDPNTPSHSENNKNNNQKNSKLKRLSVAEINNCHSSTESLVSIKRRKRSGNYRSRVIESSSDEEMNTSKDNIDNNNPDNCDTSEQQASSNVTEGNSSHDNCTESRNNEKTNSEVSSTVNNETIPGGSDDPPQESQNNGIASDSDSSVGIVDLSPEEIRQRRSRRRVLLNLALDDDEEEEEEEEDDPEEDNNDEDKLNRERRREEYREQRRKLEESIKEKYEEIISKPRPKNKWNSYYELRNRQYGSSAKLQSSCLFGIRYYDSLSVVSKLKRHTTLEFHSGCVNALNFDSSGQFLASGSDDVQIVVWEWSQPGKYYDFNSGHRNNVFQTRFMPISGNKQIVSCARDGQVRLSEYSNLGEWKTTRKLAKHARAAHKVSMKDHSHEVLSAGEDGVVFNIDIRTEKPEKIVNVKDRNGDKVALYSIHNHPLNDRQFCLCGLDEYVRVYDTRILSPFGPPAIKYCPSVMVEKKPRPSITCAVYSHNGDAILASYNDEDAFLFDTNLSEGAEPIRRYSGHRTGSTVKGVNFFGPTSRYIVSGSDCGNIFFWDRDTEAIINCFEGDQAGVVNVLEPHPSFPILATSGLDDNVKIWAPTDDEDKKIDDAIWSIVKNNLKQRITNNDEDVMSLDPQLLSMIFQQFRGRYAWRPRRSQRRPTAAEEGHMDDVVYFDMSNSSTSDSDADNSDADQGIQCATH